MTLAPKLVTLEAEQRVWYPLGPSDLFHHRLACGATVRSNTAQWQSKHCRIVHELADFIFLGSKITVDGDCSHEIKRRLLLGPT